MAQAAAAGPDGTMSSDVLRVYFENAPECLFQVRVTPERVFVYEMINPVGLARLGAALEDVIGRTPVQVLGAEAGGLITEALEHVRASGRTHAYEPTITYGGETRTYEAVYMPLLGADGVVQRILGRARDITQDRRSEASHVQAQKMEALGQLTGGVAHDFNNVLLAMAGCLKLLARQANGNASLALLAEAHRSVEHGTALTTRLLAFARQQPMASGPVDVNLCLTEMGALLNQHAGRGHPRGDRRRTRIAASPGGPQPA
jgi:signal transduction histidine kinase